MDGTEFAKELMQHFGEDRVYHCCRRTAGLHFAILAVQIRLALEPTSEPRQCVEFFRSIGIEINESLVSKVFRHPSQKEQIKWEDMCMVAFGFCKFWKEFGRRTHNLPGHLHARMILGEKNEWTEKYVELLEDFKEETDEVRKLPYGSDPSALDPAE